MLAVRIFHAAARPPVQVHRRVGPPNVLARGTLRVHLLRSDDDVAPKSRRAATPWLAVAPREGGSPYEPSPRTGRDGAPAVLRRRKACVNVIYSTARQWRWTHSFGAWSRRAATLPLRALTLYWEPPIAGRFGGPGGRRPRRPASADWACVDSMITPARLGEGRSPLRPTTRDVAGQWLRILRCRPGLFASRVVPGEGRSRRRWA